jgi:molecular chaperone IbpA
MVTYRQQMAAFDPFLKRTIGFDTLFRTLDALSSDDGGNYPPYNIIKDGDVYRIEISVSGFSENELKVVHENDTLTVTGSKDLDSSEIEYLHKGIASRDFTRRFTLAQDLVINSADISDGVLTIEMELMIPEEKKPKEIEIKSSPKLLLE